MGMIDWLRRLFRVPGAPTPPAEPLAPPTPAPEPATPPIAQDLEPIAPEQAEPPSPADDLLALSQQRRDAFWARAGAVENDVLGHLISPSLMRGPHWPTTRQAYRIVRRGDDNTLIATDGMSDPAPGQTVNGFECELFIETADLAPEVAGEPGEIEPIKRSWAFELLSHVAGMIAEVESAKAQFERYGVLSMEVPGVSQSSAIKAALPARFVSHDDALGILIGAPAPDFPDHIADMPLSRVRLLPIVILTAAELAEIRAGDAETREAIAGRLAVAPTRHRSSLTRPSIVDEPD